MQPMNTARMGACLCYVTSSNLKSINLNDSVNENNETDIDEKREE